MSDNADEWRGEEDGIEFSIYVSYDGYDCAQIPKHMLEGLMKKAGLYKYEENINVTSE